MRQCTPISFLLTLIISVTAHVALAEKLIFAQRGGGNELPDHTMPGVTLASMQGVDYIELQVVMTGDGEVIVFADLILNGVTNVGTLFPGRNRDDGNFYVADFAVNEIRQLRIENAFDLDPHPLALPISTLQEHLSLLLRLEKIRGRKVGLAIEPKKPWFHNRNSLQLSERTISILNEFGYMDGERSLYLQCYDPEELQRINDEIFLNLGKSVPLVQLIDSNKGEETKTDSLGNLKPYNYDWLFTNLGVKMISGYTAAIGLPTAALVSEQNYLPLKQYIKRVHDHGMLVFGYDGGQHDQTKEVDETNLASAATYFFEELGLDGFYTRSYQQLAEYLKKKAEEEEKLQALPPFFSNLKLSPTQSSPANEKE